MAEKSSADPLPLKATGDPEDIWFDYFESNQPAPDVVRRGILRLHEQKKHEAVIAAIRAALVNDQSQPWMYDVLALSMRIAGRPAEDIERAVYSGIDFAGADFQTMMISAAYLTRFHQPETALRMYRQGSKIAPTRPEPYIMALRLARAERDEATIRWAAQGVLAYYWASDFAGLHKEAEAALLDSAERLRKAGQTEAAKKTEQTRVEALQRDLVVRLTWNGVGDLDVLVEEPSGSVCSFDNRVTTSGGVLVHDRYGPDQDNCYEQYVCAFGLPGTYKVRIHHAWGNVVGKRARLEVIRYQGTSNESSRTFTIPLQEDDTVIRLQLGDGRRENLAEIPVETSSLPLRAARNVRLARGESPASRQAVQRFQDSRLQPAGFGNIGFAQVVTTVSEGSTLSGSAVVSADRRYVRLSLAPVFSNLTDVFTFSFQGP